MDDSRASPSESPVALNLQAGRKCNLLQGDVRPVNFLEKQIYKLKVKNHSTEVVYYIFLNSF